MSRKLTKDQSLRNTFSTLIYQDTAGGAFLGPERIMKIFDIALLRTNLREAEQELNKEAKDGKS